MTKDDVRAAAERLVEFHERFAPTLRQGPSPGQRLYLHQGADDLSRAQEYRADRAERGQRQCLRDAEVHQQRPLGSRRSPRRTFSMSSPRSWCPLRPSSPIGVVGVVDESAFTKKGNKSAGVARQHNGRLGKEDNCQVGVFLTAVTPGGAALLAHQLFLPEHWCEQTQESKERRRRGPCATLESSFQTKPQIAADLIRSAVVLDSVQLDWITADELYGRNGQFLDELEELSQNYVVEVPVTTHVWTTDPTLSVPAYCGRGRIPTRPAPGSSIPVKQVGASLPAEAWRTLWLPRGPRDRWRSSSPRFGSGRGGTTNPALRAGW